MAVGIKRRRRSVRTRGRKKCITERRTVRIIIIIKRTRIGVKAAHETV